VGAKGMVTKGAILRSPGTKYTRSKNVFAFTSIALTLVPLGTKLLEISAQFLIGSPCTLAAATNPATNPEGQNQKAGRGD